MTPVLLTKRLAAASPTAVASAQAVTSASNLTINGGSATGGVATLDTQRRVVVSSTGADSGTSATVSGTNQYGTPISEVLTMVSSGGVASSLDYLTVTNVAIAASAVGSVSVGTNGTGSTPWQMPNYHLAPFNVEIDTIVGGTVQYSIEYTQDDYATPKFPPTVPNVFTTTVSGVASGTSYAFTDKPVRGWRATVVSGTGTLSVDALQAGIVNY